MKRHLLALNGHSQLAVNDVKFFTMIVRFLPLCISAVFTAVVAVLVVTPLAWKLMGSPAEAYPELFYIAFGVPPAFILLSASAVIALLGGQKLGGPLRPTLRLLWLCMLVTVGFVALLLTPLENLIPEGVGQSVLDFTFYVAWSTLTVWMVAASVYAWTRS